MLINKIQELFKWKLYIQKYIHESLNILHFYCMYQIVQST